MRTLFPSSSCAVLAAVLLPLLLLSLLVFSLNSKQSASIWTPSWVSSGQYAAAAAQEAGGVVLATRTADAAAAPNISSAPSVVVAHRISLPAALAPEPKPAAGFDELVESKEAPPPVRPKRRDVKLEILESNLARARAVIRFAAQNPNKTSAEDQDYVPTGPVYRNPYVFHRFLNKVADMVVKEIRNISCCKQACGM